MKQSEKQRLTVLTRDAVAQISGSHPKIKAYAERAATKFSPTNAEQFRTLSEIVWWLIAVECDQDALGLLNALCEVDDEYYWMFQALASVFATRAWLLTKHAEPATAQVDAQSALQWIHGDPNAKPITESEVRGALEQFDGWLARAAGEKGTLTAMRVISHALRVLVMYQQVAILGEAIAMAVPSREFTLRLDTGVRELRQRIEGW